MAEDVVVMSPTEAQLQLAVLNSQTDSVDRRDMIVRFVNKGLPQEVVVRLDLLWNQTKVIAGEVVQIGKILLMKIWEFVEANPNMVLGMAIGAAVGALVNLIPFIGPFLAPTAMAIGAVFGAWWGFKQDRTDRGEVVKGGPIGAAEGAMAMAQEFFKLFAGIFLALKDYFLA